MKKLVLIRHAKSSWEHDVIDHERPLNKRGTKDASIIAEALKAMQLDVNCVVISDATRTKLTAQIILKTLKTPQNKVSFNHKLYDFSGGSVLEVIKNCNNTIETLMIFGHNHALTAIANTYGDTYIDNIPTCGVVIIKFNISNWSQLAPGKIVKTIFPRDFK